MLCPVCATLFGCPVCFALYAGVEVPEPRPADGTPAASPDQEETEGADLAASPAAEW